jgi:YHS domain-containing protein
VFQRDELTGLALSGLDPVTFFLPDGPKPGRTELQVVWAGVAWRFASEANKAAFVASPDAYAPRIGGYDALAASQMRIVNASPAFHAVRDGRLYLFRSEDSRARFLADASIPARSEEAWLGLCAELVQR